MASVIASELGAVPAVETGYRGSLSRILANCSWLIASGALRKLLGVVVAIKMARYLGPQQYGVFAFATAIALLLAPLAGMGLNSIAVRDLVAAGERDRDELMGTALALKLCGGIAATSAAYAAASLLLPADRVFHALVLMTAGAGVFQASEVVDFYFQSEVCSRRVVYARTPAFLAGAALQLVLIWAGASLLEFGAARPFELGLGAAGVFLSYAACGQSWRRWRISCGRARALLIDSWPLLASGVAITVFSRIDQVMLGRMAGPVDLGIYSVAVQLSEASVIVPTVVLSSVLPAIIEARRDDHELYRRRLFVLFSWLAGLSYVVAAIVTVWRGEIVAALFGGAYADASPVVAIYVWAGVFTFVGCADMAFWIAENLQRYVIALTAAAAAINIAMNYVLIPHFGPVGAALATLISYGIPTICGPALFRDSRVLFFLNMRALLRPFAPLDGWAASLSHA